MIPVTVARSDADGFDIALRRRGDIDELIVNGMFAMDSAEVTSELALADIVPADADRVLVGGLGLGYTAARLLAMTSSALVVVELSSALIGWARSGLTATLGRVAASDRVTLVHADIAAYLRRGETFDAALLDVDNGPDFLIHDANAGLYEASALRAAASCVRPDGVLAIWSERYSPALDAALRLLSDEVGAIDVPVERDGHAITYAIHTLRA